MNNRSAEKKTQQAIISFYPTELKRLIGEEKKIFHRGDILKKEKLIHFLDVLIKKYFNSGHLESNLSSKILQERYGMTYKSYIDFLECFGFLKMISNYRVGVKCKTYKIYMKHIKSSNLIEISDTVLLKHKSGYYTDDKLKKLYHNNIPFHIKKIMVDNLFNISIKEDKANYMLNSLKNDILSYKKSEYAITAIKKMDRWMTFDNFSRFHSVFTTLKSEIRKSCLINIINGKELDKEIDIGSSQPVFLVKLINDSSLKYLIDKDELNCFKVLLRPDKKQKKASIYYQILEAGKYKSVNEAKTSVYKVFFGKNNGTRNENKTFKRLFPTIYKFIVQYKKQNNHYNSLSHELQRMESHWLYNNTISKILKEIPDLVFFTVHDSITVSSGDYQVVKRIFNQELSKLYKDLDI